jgi:hypothetical protein
MALASASTPDESSMSPRLGTGEGKGSGKYGESGEADSIAMM